MKTQDFCPHLPALLDMADIITLDPGQPLLSVFCAVCDRHYTLGKEELDFLSHPLAPKEAFPYVNDRK